jgi:septum site-determining protein MinC
MAGNLVQGALFTVMVVRAGMLRDPEFQDELAQQIERSPRFFQNAPVVLDLKGAEAFASADEFARAKELLGQYALALVGVQNALPAQVEAAAEAGLASFAPNATNPSRRQAPAPEPQPTAAPPEQRAPRTSARLVTEPVRSGTQIYARGTDLIVTARGQRRRRAGRRRQHPRLRDLCAAGRWPARAAMPARESSARGSKPSWSASPGAISSASNCRRNSGDSGRRSRWSMSS